MTTVNITVFAEGVSVLRERYKSPDLNIEILDACADELIDSVIRECGSDYILQRMDFDTVKKFMESEGYTVSEDE